MSAQKKRRGQQSVYTDALADEICERLSQGESLNKICRDPHMPAENRVRQWALDDKADKSGLGAGFAAKYARARTIGYDRLADQVIDIADENPPLDALGHVDTGWVQLQRLKTDNRKWLLSKALPKKYGDRVEATITGDPNAPLLTRIELVAVPSPRAIEPPTIDNDDD
jgi:hypothetical protein